VDAQTNPKAKTITTTRYVHSNCISDRFSGGGVETLAEKVEPGAKGLTLARFNALRQVSSGRLNEPGDDPHQAGAPGVAKLLVFLGTDLR
jgi:hypothetical protein